MPTTRANKLEANKLRNEEHYHRIERCEQAVARYSTAPCVPIIIIIIIIVNVERPTKNLLLLAESLCRSLLLSELALRPHTVNSSNNYGYSPDIIANKQTQAPRAAWDMVFMQSFYEVDDLRHSPLHHSCVNLFGLAHRGLPLTQLPSGLSQAETKHMHYG